MSDISLTPSDHGWGPPVVSIYSLTLLLAALGITWLMHSTELLMVLVGVIATNSTNVVQFYVGSSRSSQTKDATIAQQLPQPASSAPSPSANTIFMANT